MMRNRFGLMWILLLSALHLPAYARGVTPYLPLNLDPEVERQIERVLILGDKPVMTRPIAAARVLDALPKACEVDAVLCENVRKFLSRYMHGSGIEFASIEGSVSGGSNPVMPNQHGRTEQSHYQLAGAVYTQPLDHLLISMGGVAYQGRWAATGTLISAGWDWAQLDIGYRDHWWSPMTDSAMLISTEAPTMPSITLSNYRPLTRIGLQYELFVARMSQTDQIVLTNGQFTRGYPKFAGIHLGIEPTSGWSLAVNRALVFGGGAAGGQSFQDLLNAFLNPSKGQSTGFGGGKPIGKQEASVTSRFIFPGKMPFAVYFEYAGNDTSMGKNYLLGKPDLSAGIHFPHLGRFDVTYEISEWQETWYVHPAGPVQIGYLDGITNYGRSIGHWFGDQRRSGDAAGGQSNMLRVGWEPSFGGLLETQYRVIVNQSYSTVPYRHGYSGSLTYSYPWRGYAVGAEVEAGQDVFGGHFGRLAGFMRYGDALRSSYSADGASTSRRADGAELFVDAGMNANRVSVDISNVLPRYTTRVSFGPHLGLGARREVSQHQDLGVRVEADDVRGHALVAVRALDYRYRFRGPLAWNAFLGAARYALATPAYGWYLGTGVQWRDMLPGWDLGLDYRYGVKIARQHDLPSDPQGNRPDSFYDINSLSLYISRKF
jgi:hypothetical protein